MRNLQADILKKNIQKLACESNVYPDLKGLGDKRFILQSIKNYKERNWRDKIVNYDMFKYVVLIPLLSLYVKPSFTVKLLYSLLQLGVLWKLSKLLDTYSCALNK